VQAACY